MPHREPDHDGPTDSQIEDAEIERQIEYSEEALRGEHGEDAQRKEMARRSLYQQRAANDKKRDEEIATLTAALGSPALVKACLDHFSYALKLKSGEVIQFASASWHGNGWLTLVDISASEQPHNGWDLPFPADRGVDVRLENILWVMDAPCGS